MSIKYVGEESIIITIISRLIYTHCSYFVCFVYSKIFSFCWVLKFLSPCCIYKIIYYILQKTGS